MNKLITIMLILILSVMMSVEVFADLDDEVTAESVIMIDADTGVTIYERNADESLYPASITKVMTTLLFIEHVEAKSLETGLSVAEILKSDRIYFSSEVVNSIEMGSSSIYMNAGETLSAEEALMAIMLKSANDVSAAVGEYISGSEEAFSKLMTARAKELGCISTQFKNAHGLHDVEHYTTARDMALIMQEAIKHELFIETIRTWKYCIENKGGGTENTWLFNSNRLIDSNDNEFYYPNVVGGKTGFTDEAQHTIVNYGEKDGKKIIVVVMKAKKNMIFADTIAMMEVGFNEFYNAELLTEAKLSENILVDMENGRSVSAKASKAVSIRVPKTVDISLVKRSNVLDENLSFPIKIGDIIGEMEFYYEEKYLTSVELLANEEVKESDFPGNEKAVTASSDVSEDNSGKKVNVVLLAITILLFAVAVAGMITLHRMSLVKRNMRNKERYKYKNDWFK